MSSNHGAGPLKDILVLDLSQVYQGPYATFLMARAGANVIKIEPPTGEAVRRRARISLSAGAPFAMLNGGKRSITLDLKKEEGKEVFKKLAKKADVLVENFTPGVMDRLGLGWSVLSELNPQLIYGQASGYGITGSDATNRAMDVTIQAMSGMMSVTGFPDGPPVKGGPAVVDFLSGTHLYAGIVTALLERQHSGKGSFVEVAMQETVYPALASNLGFIYGENGGVPPRTGNRHGGLAEAPYNVYPTKDGHISIICITDSHWNNLLKIIGREDLIGDERFSSNPARVARMEETDALVQGWTETQSRDGAYAALTAAKVPSAPVRDLVEVTNDENMHERGMLKWVDHPEFGRICLHNSPIRIHGTEDLPFVASPTLGEHNEQIMSDLLDFSEEEIGVLQEENVLGPTEQRRRLT